MTQLNPQLTAARALRQVLQAQLAVVRGQLLATRQGTDIEALHDLRVAVRRSRSVLGQLPRLLPDTETARLKQELKWLGTVSGPTRDLDVYLDGLPAYFEHLGDSAPTDLAPLVDLLHRRRDQEQARLAQALSSSRLEDLMAFWQQVVSSDATDRGTHGTCGSHHGTRGNRNVRAVADQRILRAHRKVVRDGRNITDESPAQALHDLRIRCKKLRYLLELFRSLYVPAEVKNLIAVLKKLQSLLGDFNDRAVQFQQTKIFRHQLQASGQESAACSRATRQLLDRLAFEQNELRCRFGERFAEFDQQVDESRYGQLFDS